MNVGDEREQGVKDEAQASGFLNKVETVMLLSGMDSVQGEEGMEFGLHHAEFQMAMGPSKWKCQ